MAQYDVDDLRAISALTPDTLLAALKVSTSDAGCGSVKLLACQWGV